jgi:hypothetical protein
MKQIKFFLAFLLVLGSVAFWAEPGLALLQKGGIWNVLIFLNAFALSFLLAFVAKGDAKVSFSWIVAKDDQENVILNRFLAIFVFLIVVLSAGAYHFIKEA